eukprot:Gb_04852 [translate_table: standard]
MQAIVEQVRDGSTVRVYLLPDFQFVQVFVVGIQCLSMGRSLATIEAVSSSEVALDETNREVESAPSITSAQRLATSIAIDVCNVRIVLEGVDETYDTMRETIDTANKKAKSTADSIRSHDTRVNLSDTAKKECTIGLLDVIAQMFNASEDLLTANAEHAQPGDASQRRPDGKSR